MKPDQPFDKKLLIQAVIRAEWDMFQKVRSSTPAACQQSPEQFKRIRISIFSTWGEELLASYLNDLKLALEEDRNLMMEKYARMDDMIEQQSSKPLIKAIINIEYQWQMEIKSCFPALYQRVCRQNSEEDNGSDFSKYLKSELETYSPETIEFYYSHVNQAQNNNNNLALKALDYLVRSNGFTSTQHAEKIISEQIGG